MKLNQIFKTTELIIGRAKRGHVKRECEQRIADAVRLELGAPKVTASRRPALYIQKKRKLLLIEAFSDFLGIFEENRPLIIRLGDFRPMPAHEHLIFIIQQHRGTLCISSDSQTITKIQKRKEKEINTHDALERRSPSFLSYSHAV